MTVKLQLYVTEEAAEIISRSTTDKNKGKWLSDVIVEYDRLMTEDTNECGALEQIRDRLWRIERRLTHMETRRVDRSAA